jgi:protein SCO1
MSRRRLVGQLGATLMTFACLCLALGVIWQLTAGLTIFTSEAWRRADVQTSPRPLPNLRLEDELGEKLELGDLCGRVLVVDFVYTQCPTICKSLGASSSQLARQLAQADETADALVVSISFDPRRDTPARLRAFRSAMEPSPTGWRLLRPTDEDGMESLLRSFGVVAIDDGLGGFDHNAALHVVDRECRVARILDADNLDAAIAAVRELMSRRGA